jgi:hypothetical protein
MKHRWCSLAFGLLLLIAGSGNLWAAEDRTAVRYPQSQERLAHRSTDEVSPDQQEIRREQYKLLEWVIMQDLLAKYQKLEKNEYSVDNDD